jgi:putative DNA primase/helicase
VPSAIDAADGQWPRLLQELGGLAPEQLTNTHQPCPACGGTDRYRWDRDDGPGGWFCNQCGGKDHRGGAGSGMDLLTRVTGWPFADACRRIEQHLGITITPPIPEPPTAGAEHVWRYSDTFYVCRFPQKRIRPLWYDGTAWRWKVPPSPRPLYWARRAAGAPVLITEGEKAADAAATLFPDHAIATWPSGCKAIDKADWNPLRGRSVVLWPDADQPGRDAMAKLATRLLALNCTLQVVNPPESAPNGWDLADALAEGWTPDRAARNLQQFARTIEPPEPETVQTVQAEPGTVQTVPAAATPPAHQPFTCLGFDEGNYYYQPSSTGQITRIGRGNHTETHLLTLCPELSYWETLYPSRNGINWTAAKASLFAQQAKVGIFSPDRIRGRGAWWDDGRAVLHLGDRLIVDGVAHSVMKPPPSRFSYQRLAAIDIPADLQPLTDQQGAEILDIASRFLWEVPASGLLIAGWAALAPICGSLSWRPHIWLTASAGSGKSVLLDRFLGTLLDSLALWPEGSTSEASIRQELRADALPVIMDEAESNELADRNRIQNILALARVASSSGRGFVGRGGADGAAQRYVIRSMFLLCSISTALKQGADASRFAQLTLRNPSFMPLEQRQAHWTELDRDLTAIITPTLGHRMALRSVAQIPIIRDSVAAFRRAAANRFDSQRQADQYGTLLAGAWSLMNDRVATDQDAYALIDANDWTQYREATEQSDEERCLARILQHQLRVEADRGAAYQRTVWELVEIIRGTATCIEITAAVAEAHLGRIGLRVMDGRLLVANTALGLQRILADTPWATSWPTILSRLPDAQKPGKVRFRGMERNSRAVSLPLDLG